MSVQCPSGVNGYDLLAAEQRRQILQLMGIDVWVQRRERDAEPVSVQADQAQETVPVAAGRSSPASTAELKRDLQQVTQPAAKSGSPVSPEPASVTNQQPAADIFPACQILAVRQADVLVLADMAQQTLARRLGRDLVASTTRQWQKRPAETLFDWQPEQLSGMTVDGRRALLAFVSRQLDELDAGSLIIADVLVQERLPELADLIVNRAGRFCPVPSLDQLANDAGAKRDLWAQLQQLRA